jgi:hypothetical protein
MQIRYYSKDLPYFLPSFTNRKVDGDLTVVVIVAVVVPNFNSLLLATDYI